MERSLHSRGFRTPCTFRHRCRQSPQRSIRFPSRSMWMIMYLSVSSTLVTVCAFNLSCFLRNVSMSTSILFLSVAVHHSPQKIRCIGDSDQPLHRQPAASKTLRLQLHFRDRNQMLLREPDCVISSSTSDFQSLAGNNRRGGHSLNQAEVRLADVPRCGAFFIVFIETIFGRHDGLSPWNSKV